MLCWVGLGLGYDDGFGDPWLSQMGEERETANTTTLSIYLVVDNKEGGYAASRVFLRNRGPSLVTVRLVVGFDVAQIRTLCSDDTVCFLKQLLIKLIRVIRY